MNRDGNPRKTVLLIDGDLWEKNKALLCKTWEPREIQKVGEIINMEIMNDN